MESAFKLNAAQIESIINKLVPLIASNEDQYFFRAILRIKAEESSSGAFGAFVNDLLKSMK